MKKQSDWMKGLLYAEKLVETLGYESAKLYIEKLKVFDGVGSDEGNVWYDGLHDYFVNYEERNNVKG